MSDVRQHLDEHSWESSIWVRLSSNLWYTLTGISTQYSDANHEDTLWVYYSQLTDTLYVNRLQHVTELTRSIEFPWS